MNQQDSRNEITITDLEAPNADAIKGGPLDAGRVRLSTSSGVADDYFKKGDGDKISKPVNG
jgi:hypothetical protein